MLFMRYSIYINIFSTLNSLRKESKEPCDSNDKDLHGNTLEDKNDNK